MPPPSVPGSLSLFAGSMLLLILAGTWLVAFVAWEVVGACSALLVGFLLLVRLGEGRIAATLEPAALARLWETGTLVVALLVFAGAAGIAAVAGNAYAALLLLVGPALFKANAALDSILRPVV